MKKQFLVISLCVGGVMMSCSDNLNEGKNEKESDLPTVGQDKSFEVYGNLDDSFMGKTRSINEVVYSSYYGGSYIDDDGGLVVLSTDGGKSIVEDLQSRSKSSDFVVKQCKYSLNDLQGLNIRLGEIFKDGKIAEDLKWVSVGIDVMNNKVRVDLEDCSEQMINKFKSTVLDSPMIEFNKMLPINFESECAPVPQVWVLSETLIANK
ncbi:hypothetical protein Bache_0989 [Bacteroides helcogenes P 36-108]|uniref:Lipoprotein n=2 Tax=Bacteroides helcogenes TaxID=290053 RepID=E6SQM9_BACT6|nr:hypothetical protein Bache_0989 [Bacteroides helcogenes P 36-108]